MANEVSGDLDETVLKLRPLLLNQIITVRLKAKSSIRSDLSEDEA